MAVRKNTRRRFLLEAACLAPVIGATRMLAEEPFDSLPASAWKNARMNGLVMIHRPSPVQLSWQTLIVKKGEPGEPLIVAGKVFAPDGRTPAAGVTVYAYNTDAEGYYGENRAEYPPRIYGWMKTDAAGRFELRTIYPGCYPKMQVPAHIHFEAWGGGYPLQWTEGLRFEGDKYITPEMRADDARLGDFRATQRVSRGSDGVLRCGLQIRLGKECTFH
jgi:protocatechuate 3,4-dioxygenase beta subunit